MSKRVEILRERLEKSREYLNRVLDAVGDRWETQVYSDGAQWNVHQLLIHIAIADIGMLRNMQSIAQGIESVPADFDVERYNRRSVEKRADMTVEEARASLERSRAATEEWLASIDDDTLELAGRHPSMQILTIAQHLKVMSNHEQDHARDIASVLQIDA
ncbi:DinB family protein [Anaerolineae bacterium CFX9]|jgi:uncharacterized damage-inducible protein DinB|nr:DinB family protein [Oscillatoria laete-virens]MDL1900964.1 DinB family protein [Anaerolineae bacterium CFX9]MDL5054568.1 DinB family protein [Oscillatoria laete-virens NRMC-F 0139]